MGVLLRYWIDHTPPCSASASAPSVGALTTHSAIIPVSAWYAFLSTATNPSAASARTQIHGAPSKATTCNPRSKAIFLPHRNLHQSIDLHAACGKIIPHTRVSLHHHISKPFHFPLQRSLPGRLHPAILGNNVSTP